MFYLIDGYNLLFFVFHSEKKIEKQRALVIDFLLEKTSKSQIKIILVFDAHNTKHHIASHSYKKAMKIVYTPKDQTADEYILEKVFLSKNPGEITVVTSDRSLTNEVKNLKAQTKSIENFLSWISQKEIKERQQEKIDFNDSDRNIKRLNEIFEKRLNDDLDYW